MASDILIYQNTEGNIKVDVRLEDETVWLTQDQMAQLFGKGRSTITEHIGNVFKEGELDENVARRKFRHTTPHVAVAGKTQEIEVNLNKEPNFELKQKNQIQYGKQILITMSQELIQNVGEKLPESKGFSESNLNKMRPFHETWSTSISISSSVTNQLENDYDLVKQPHENPSIGIILCKEKDDKKVEYSFRDFSKPMGVSTFKTSDKVTQEFKNALHAAETHNKLMD